jgi:hypothetical protein
VPARRWAGGARTAATSSRPQGVARPFTRTTTSRCPYPPRPTSCTTSARAAAFVSAARAAVGAWPSATLRTHTNAPYKVLPDPLMGAVEGVYAIRWAQRPGVTASSRSMMRQSAARVRAFMPGARPSEFSMEGIFYI